MGEACIYQVDSWKAQGLRQTMFIKFDVSVLIHFWLRESRLLHIPPCISRMCESLGKTWRQKNRKRLLKAKKPLPDPASGKTNTCFKQRLGGRSDSLPAREKASHLPTADSLPSQERGRASLHLGPPFAAWKESREVLLALAQSPIMFLI